MIFSFIVLFSLGPLRRMGWFLSKNFIYWMRMPFVVFFSIVWGILIAYLLHILILWQNPGLVIKIILGYGAGSYLAIPDYGLFDEHTLSEEAAIKNIILFFVSLSLFIVSSIAFAFFDS
jgi:hypothetical protein